MLTRSAIEAYHTREGSARQTPKIGIELELFCLDNHTLKTLPYQARADRLSVQTLFAYLKEEEDYSEVDVSKTFELQKGRSKIALEPGAQMEFCSTPCETLEVLLKELWNYFEVLKRMAQRFDVSWLDASYFPIGSAVDVPLLPSARCEIIDSYWQQTGRLGRDLMRYTTSLHVSFDYDDASDLTAKVERALLLKPILLFLTASSRIRQKTDTGVRSFRTLIYQDTDAPRTGTPGPETLWCHGHWTLAGYIDKVLNAPAIFAVGAPTYQEAAHEPFVRTLAEEASFSDYLSHLATIYTDVRIRHYLEIRYMDNPGVHLLPGLLIFLYALFYDETMWADFKQCIPYAFHEVPRVTTLLNTVSETADRYWEAHLLGPVRDFLLALQKRTAPGLREYLDNLIQRTVEYKSRDILPDLRSDASILAHYKSVFPF